MLYQANENGSWYFMSLRTREKIHSNNWVELPITDAIINAVNARGQEEQQPDIRDGTPIFEWRRDIPFNDDDAESVQEHSDDKYNPEEAGFRDEERSHDGQPNDNEVQNASDDEVKGDDIDDHDEHDENEIKIDEDQRSTRKVTDEEDLASNNGNTSDIEAEYDPPSKPEGEDEENDGDSTSNNVDPSNDPPHNKD